MKRSTVEWINKAEGDFFTAQMAYRARLHPNYDAAYFHTQQCAEKYLKARLEEAGQTIPPIHNLYALLTLVLPFEPKWQALSADLNSNTFAGMARSYRGSPGGRPFVGTGHAREILSTGAGLTKWTSRVTT